MTNLKCQQCNSRYEYMSKEEYDNSSLCYEINISHSKELCQKCHSDWLKEEVYKRIMDTRNFRTIPESEKMELLMYELPSNICCSCGMKVGKDKARYDPTTGITYFNVCSNCEKLEK